MTIRMTKRVTDVGTDMESTDTGAVFTIFLQHTRHCLACFDNVDVLVFASPRLVSGCGSSDSLAPLEPPSHYQRVY